MALSGDSSREGRNLRIVSSLVAFLRDLVCLKEMSTFRYNSPVSLMNFENCEFNNAMPAISFAVKCSAICPNISGKQILYTGGSIVEQFEVLARGHSGDLYTINRNKVWGYKIIREIARSD